MVPPVTLTPPPPGVPSPEARGSRLKRRGRRHDAGARDGVSVADGGGLGLPGAGPGMRSADAHVHAPPSGGCGPWKQARWPWGTRGARARWRRGQGCAPRLFARQFAAGSEMKRRAADWAADRAGRPWKMARDAAPFSVWAAFFWAFSGPSVFGSFCLGFFSPFFSSFFFFFFSSCFFACPGALSWRPSFPGPLRPILLPIFAWAYFDGPILLGVGTSRYAREYGRAPRAAQRPWYSPVLPAGRSLQPPRRIAARRPLPLPPPPRARAFSRRA